MIFFEKIINSFVNFFGNMSSFLLFPMILITFFVAITRYIFDFGSIALQELIIYLHAFIFLGGIIYITHHNKNVRIDIFYNKFNKIKKNLVNTCGTLFFLLITSTTIILTSFDYVLQSVILQESSREAGGLPFVYILKSFILIMAFGLLLHGLHFLLKNYKK